MKKNTELWANFVCPIGQGRKTRQFTSSSRTEGENGDSVDCLDCGFIFLFRGYVLTCSARCGLLEGSNEKRRAQAARVLL